MCDEKNLLSGGIFMDSTGFGLVNRGEARVGDSTDWHDGILIEFSSTANYHSSRAIPFSREKRREKKVTAKEVGEIN